MPVATSSRRKLNSRHQAPSDIEEDQLTQEKSDQNEEDEQPVYKKRKKSLQKLRPVPTDGVHEDEDEDGQDSKINVEDFRNQPVGKGDLLKLKGLSTDWQRMEKEIRQNWGVVGDVAVAIADANDANDSEKGIEELDIIMKDLIDIGYEMKSHEKTLDDIYQKVGQGEDIDDVVDRYRVRITKDMEEYVKKTTRQKYAKSEEYGSFRQGIYEVQNPDKAMPPITEFIPKEDGDDSDDDDELEVGGVTQKYTCPITLVPLLDPLTSQVCGHSFSAEAIRATFRGSSADKKCPASGCNKSFHLSDCKPNKELAKKVKAWKRRAERAEENSDAEEIIE